MIVLPHAPLGAVRPPHERPSWRENHPTWVERHPHSPVTITCSFGHETSLSLDVHRIAGDGTVTPSCVCSHDGCSFHEHVRLEGWSTP